VVAADQDDEEFNSAIHFGRHSCCCCR